MFTAPKLYVMHTDSIGTNDLGDKSMTVENYSCT